MTEEMFRLGKLVIKLAQLTLDQEVLEDKLKEVTKERRTYEEQLVPELMTEIGLDSLTTATGIKVEMKTDIKASFPKDPERQAEAIEWLKETGNEGLLKHEISLLFGRNQEHLVERVKEILESGGFCDWVEHHTVHPQTLGKFLKDQLAEGADIPVASFGGFIRTSAKIKR